MILVMWNRVETFIKSCIDNSVPKKVVKKNKNLPWMSKEIRKLCTKKKMLCKRAKYLLLPSSSLRTVVID